MFMDDPHFFLWDYDYDYDGVPYCHYDWYNKEDDDALSRLPGDLSRLMDLGSAPVREEKY